MDSYQQFTGARCRARCIFEPEHFRPAVVVDSHCFHVFHFAHLLGQDIMKVFKVQVSIIEPCVWRLRRERLSGNVVCGFRHKRFEQRFEARTQSQFFTFLLKPFLWISCGLQRVAEVR
jgi:hypothetical protein